MKEVAELDRYGFLAIIAALVWLGALVAWAIGRWTPSGRATEVSRDLVMVAVGLVILSWFVHF